MKALLDTRVWLWMLTDPQRLGQVREVVEDPEVELLLSAVSTWEIAIKHALGRLPLPEPPTRYVPGRIRSPGVAIVPLGLGDTLAMADLPSTTAARSTASWSSDPVPWMLPSSPPTSSLSAPTSSC